MRIFNGIVQRGTARGSYGTASSIFRGQPKVLASERNHRLGLVPEIASSSRLAVLALFTCLVLLIVLTLPCSGAAVTNVTANGAVTNLSGTITFGNGTAFNAWYVTNGGQIVSA